MPKIVAACSRSRRRKLEAGHPKACWREKWKWKDSVSTSGRRARKSLRVRFLKAMVWMASVVVLAASGMLINGLDIPVVTARIEALRASAVGEDKLSVRDHRHLEDDFMNESALEVFLDFW
jgi:hypothetical protein